MTSLYITESGAYLHKRGGQIVIGRNNEVLLEVPLNLVEDVTLIDSVQISSQLMTDFLERRVPISWLSTMGCYYGSLINANSVDILKHKKQFDLLQEEKLYFTLAKKCVFAKVHNQLTILRRYNRNAEISNIDSAIKNILAVRRNIFLTDSYREVMGYEGIISRIYFAALGELMPEGFCFTKRTKMPPRDPVNSMLSLGYSMLFNEVLASCIHVGLHPYVGFLHRLAKGHPALASDLMEEWRAPIVDAMVLAMLKRNMLEPEQFTTSEEGCFLTPEARKIFLGNYNKKLRSQNQYLDGKYSYRESIRKQCEKYASAIMNEDADYYEPLELR